MHACLFLLERCCDKVVVKANGNAKQDQSLYLGTYEKISTYNGHHAYEREGKERLYIYFYSSLVSLIFAFQRNFLPPPHFSILLL